MSRTITSSMIAQALCKAIPKIACELPRDIAHALREARVLETHPRGRIALDQLLENMRIASEDQVPLCQDTGTVWVCLEIGPDITISGDVFCEVDATVAKTYEQARLRKSVVRDAFFDRTNTGDNIPAFCEITFSEKPGTAFLHVMLKGGGSDNASRVTMLTPGAGKKGIIDEVLRCVEEKAPNACPPLVVGIGIGSTFDKVGSLAKKALMRPVTDSVDSPTDSFEQELLTHINATGIGPAGVGGKITALAVKINTAPCHIAAMPLAINMGCCAMRRCSVAL